MGPDITSFFDEATNTISYIVCDPNGSACAIIDSVLDFDFAELKASRLVPQTRLGHYRAEVHFCVK